MARSRSTFSKRENEKKKQKRREDKNQKREEKKANAESGKSLDDMIAYVDEFGNISDTPPDPEKKKKEVSMEIQKLIRFLVKYINYLNHIRIMKK